MKSSVRILAGILKLLSRLTIRKYEPFIIGVTGSTGKTSAKEAIHAALTKSERIRRTSLNFNNELGLPLTILGEWQKLSRPIALFWLKVISRAVWQLVVENKEYPEVLVLEYGSDGPGDIERLVGIAKPDVGVITAIGSIPVHVENYPGGIEEVFREKSKLVSSLNSSKTAVLNADDPFFKKLTERVRAKIISYGFSENADIRISNFSHLIREDRIGGVAFKINYKNAIVPITIPSAFSISHAYAAACAMAVALERGVNMIDASALIHTYRPVYGRSVLIQGIKNTQLIDESYNSSPLALETALKTLAMVHSSRRVAVLGDMLELGSYTLQAHEHAGELAAKSVDVLITVGARAKFIAYKAKEKGLHPDKVCACETAAEAGKKLQAVMKEGDVVLIKGSHSIGLEAVVKEVRQE